MMLVNVKFNVNGYKRDSSVVISGTIVGIEQIYQISYHLVQRVEEYNFNK